MDATEQSQSQKVRDISSQALHRRVLRRGVRTARTLVQVRELEADWAEAYVYGAITTLAIVGGEQLAPRANPLGSAGVIVVGVGAVWLAKAFSGLVADWIRNAPVNVGAVFERLRHSWPTLFAALPAAFLLGLADAGVYAVSTGLWLDEYVSLLALFLIGVWAAVVSSRRLAVRLCFPIVLVGIGWLIVGLEQLAKHF